MSSGNAFNIGLILGALITLIFIVIMLNKYMISYEKLEKYKIVVKDPLTKEYKLNEKILRYLKEHGENNNNG